MIIFFYESCDFIKSSNQSLSEPKNKADLAIAAVKIKFSINILILLVKE